ncbi:MAG TPA: TetR family transcriptional regulator [Acidimicrobiales bacterium]
MALPDTATTSRRDEHKRRTRAALRDAALDLFSRRGFDATTTEEIAERAGVAVRTFFRYFPTKESVLYIGESEWIHSVVTELASMPSSVGDLEAVRAAILRTTGPLSHARGPLLQYSRAVASSPTLRGREQDYHRANAHLLAEAIATRRGVEAPDRRSTMIARISLFTYRRALDLWLGGPDTDELPDVIDREFELLEEVVREP